MFKFDFFHFSIPVPRKGSQAHPSITHPKKHLSLLTTSFALLLAHTHLGWAKLPDINSDLKFKERVATAIAEHSSSFQYPGEELEDTYVLGFHQHSHQATSSRSKRELQKLLLNEKTRYNPKKTSDAGRLSVTLFDVLLPKGSSPKSFQISLTPLPGYTEEDITDLGLPLIQSQNKLSFRLKIIALIQNYLRDRKVSALNEQLTELELALKSELPTDKKFILETQKAALIQEITSISNPVEKLRYIVENISPMAFRDYPLVVFLQILQEAKLIDPPLTDAILAASKTPEINPTEGASLDPSAPEIKNCIDLGGRIEAYTKGKSQDALLCRFGEGGIGAGSLYQFKNKESVKSISAYLHYVPYVTSSKEQLAIIPSGKNEDGTAKGFGLSDAPAPLPNLEPAMKLVLNPSVKVSEYCRQREGKPTQLHHKGDGSEFKACIFDDFSGIDAKTLFKGPEDGANAQLTRVLKSLQ